MRGLRIDYLAWICVIILIVVILVSVVRYQVPEPEEIFIKSIAINNGVVSIDAKDRVYVLTPDMIKGPIYFSCVQVYRSGSIYRFVPTDCGYSE